jgi:hypothetical protein
MDPRQLLDRYQATGDEDVFAAAQAAYESALAAAGDAVTVATALCWSATPAT